MIIDGKWVKVTKSRNSSTWYTHPVNGRSCMRAKKTITLGYHTALAAITAANVIQKEITKNLSKPDLFVHVSYQDKGYEYRTNRRLIELTITGQESVSSWGEQRLQELLDDIQIIKGH